MAANPVDHFSWFQKIDALHGVPDHIAHTIFVSILLSIAAVLAYVKLKNPAKNVLPESRLTIKTFFELVTEFVLSLTSGLLGENTAKFIPLIATIFIYVFACNVIGLIPGFQSPTTNLSTNLAVGLTVFVYYNIMGLKEHGWGYVKHFMGPVWWLAPLMFLIEMIGHIVRPMSLSLRLGGNMMGDHMVLGIFSNLIPIGIPIIFLGLGLFVCLIQAFVFTLLTTIYIAMATAHEEHH